MFGAVIIPGAVLILFPKTFIRENFITATAILLIIAFHLCDKDLTGGVIELPFLLLCLVMIYEHIQYLTAEERNKSGQ